MRMTLLERLQAAKALLNNGWTRNALARDCYGEPTDIDSSDAVCFCAMGALRRANLTSRRVWRTETYDQAVALVLAELPEGFSTLPHFNDTPGRTKREVRDLFTRAIRKQRARTA